MALDACVECLIANGAPSRSGKMSADPTKSTPPPTPAVRAGAGRVAKWNQPRPNSRSGVPKLNTALAGLLFGLDVGVISGTLLPRGGLELCRAVRPSGSSGRALEELAFGNRLSVGIRRFHLG
jgi:hypothetical protein